MSGDRDRALTVISIHDVAPASFAASRHLVEAVERIGARASLLVIPGPWRGHDVTTASAFTGWLCEAEAVGHEIVVHGWEHLAVHDPRTTVRVGRRAYNRVLTRGCAEFSSLGAEEAQRRASAGRQVLTAAGTNPIGFTPPGWLASAAAMWTLRNVGFEYTTSRGAIHDLSDGRRIEIPAYAQRSSRPLARPAATAVERIVHQRLEGGRAVRVALHVDDLEHVRLARSTDTLLAAVARSGARTATYAEVVREERIGLATDPRVAT